MQPGTNTAGSSGGGQWARNFASNQGLLIVLALLIVAFSFAMPETFPRMANFRNILTSQAVILVIALAVTMPLRGGDFDLSVSAVMALSASVIGVLCGQLGYGLALAIPLAMLAGLGVGLVNMSLVVLLGLDGFVATLGSMTAVLGLTSWMTGGEVIGMLPKALVSFSNTAIGPLPALVLYGWILALIFWYIYEQTPFGRYLLFTGGNREAARLTGVRVNVIRSVSFIVASLVSAFAGILFAGNLGAVDPEISHAYLLPPYAAAFLGSTTIQIGRFNIAGTVIGLYLLSIGVSGLQLLGAEGWVSDVFNGVALIAAVAFAKLIRKVRTT